MFSKKTESVVEFTEKGFVFARTTAKAGVGMRI
jgi:hypothetical protein